jgi:hypothetical protein
MYAKFYNVMIIISQDTNQLVVQLLTEVERSLNICFEAVVIG